MKRSLILCVAVVAALSTVPAAVYGAMVFQDDFNKSDQALVGTTPNTSTGNWTQTGATATNPIQISGNQVALTTTGQDAYAAFSAAVPNADGTSLRTSADITLSAVQTGDYFLHLSDPVGTTGNFYQRLGAQGTAGGYFLTLAVTGGGNGATTPGTTVLALNTTYHVDVDWNFAAGPLNDSFTVSVNGSPYLTKAWDSTNGEPAQVTAANFRQGTASAAPTVTVDNLTVQTVTQVVPEPATLVLASMVGLVGLACRRSRR